MRKIKDTKLDIGSFLIVSGFNYVQFELGHVKVEKKGRDDHCEDSAIVNKIKCWTKRPESIQPSHSTSPVDEGNIKALSSAKRVKVELSVTGEFIVWFEDI